MSVRAKPLTVYTWQGYRRSECPRAPNGDHATREICAAPSKAAVARAAGVDRPAQLFNLGETGNAADIVQALSEPGVVFWRPLDDRKGEWRRAAVARKVEVYSKPTNGSNRWRRG